MVIVTAQIHARLDTVDELRRLSLEHVARSRAEPGCLEHGVSIDANDGLRLVFFERWADRAALQAHFELPASREFAAAARRCAAHPPEIVVYEASELPTP
jgi:quinol monooxygenase YgiN